MRRTILIGWLSLLFPLAALAVAPEAPRPLPDAAAGASRAPLADRDGDRISDGLQAALAEAVPADRFRVVVSFSGPGDAASAGRAVGPFELHHEFTIIRGFAATMTAAQIRALARVPGVFRIEEDFRVSINLDAARSDFGADAARFAYGASGSAVGICIVDTGVDPTHEQLDGKAPIAFVNYQDPSRTSAYDDNGHGTHVSSIAAGDGVGGANADRYKGIAPGASLHVAKVLDGGGSGSESNVILGIQWCAGQAGVRVISMSLASDAPSDGQDGMSQAANNAVAAGKVVVVAAGNFGDEPQTVGSPGAAANAITVGACAEWSAAPGRDNHSDGVYLAPWSGRGPTLDGRTKPDVCGPGHSITAALANSAGGLGYITYSGTSMATPFVAGLIALALEEQPALTPAQISQALEASAQGRGPDGKDNDWGAGLVDGYAFAALVRGESQVTAFPTYQRVTGSVGHAPAKWTYTFSVAQADLGKPIAAMITIVGSPKCVLDFGPLGCWAWEWSPDLDAELYDPAGNRIALAGCMGLGECGGIGRQESLHAMPTFAGQYRIEVSGAEDTVNQGQGGSFALDLSIGPLAFGSGPPPPPAADFSLSASPLSRTVTRGATTTYAETVTPSGGFTGAVSLAVSSKLPNGVTATFSPNPVAVPGSVPVTSTLTVTTRSKSRRGTYTLTITGTSGSLSHTNTVTLIIQ